MVTIASQFNGPPTSGNGGYVCGLLGREVGSDVATSTLRQPPPLDVPLAWERHGDAVHLVTGGGAVVGESVPGTFVADPPPAPTDEEAQVGRAAYRGFHHHPFDRCFTCGTSREEGDGLRIFTGPVDEHRVAGPWTPHRAFDSGDGTTSTPVTWAALDCPGGWAADFTAQLMLLGRMTAQVLRAPRIDEPLLSSALLIERDGRKFRTATALHTSDGELVGRAEQVWIEVAEA